MYPTFLDYGYTSVLFWESSLKEVTELILSKRRIEQKENDKQIEELKVRAIMNEVLAKQIVELIAISLSGDKEATMTPLSEYYPKLFENEKNIERKKIDTDLRFNKAKMEEFAYWHNKQRKGVK